MIEGLTHFFCRKGDEKLFNLRSKVFHVKRLAGIDDFWSNLLAKNSDFSARVTAWLEQEKNCLY